eukprot:TRINITY_DN56713_c0_g1_i1.p1 TRINITY_DN56713_c0_g1~~TRINITY_DN56713_c0_g1_i1.p1  ORF type:complete len:679 (-),score=165.11 TRINITY_DN56713_c0_g1_i1:23-2035(-)
MASPAALLRALLGTLFVFLSFQAGGQQLTGAGRGTSLGAASFGAGGQSALQDAVQGIAGLMQRFERLQPQLAALPPTQLESIAGPAQQLHERFLAMQQKLGAADGAVAPALEQEAITFHRDLALFVDRVSERLGIAGPASAGLGSAGFAPVSLGDLPQAGTASYRGAGGAAASPATERRLQAAMQSIQSNMQRFETLHPKLRTLPQQTFTVLAGQAQQLHEEFLVLQRRGIELAGDGRRPMLEGEAAPYAEQLESYVARQGTFVTGVDEQVRSLGGSAAGLGGSAFGSMGYQGMVGDRIPVPPAGTGAGAGLSNRGLGAGSMPQVNLPPLQLGGNQGLGGGPTPQVNLPPLQVGGSQGLGGRPMPQVNLPPLQPGGGLGRASPTQVGGSFGGPGCMPGQVTAATDARLSAVIDKVTSLMQEFQGIAPQLARGSQQVLAALGSTGTALDNRFRELQRRGTVIAGDGTRPMSESDASKFAEDMEAFYAEQKAYVEQARQAIQAGGGAGMAAGRPGMLGAGALGSASLRDLRGDTGSGLGVGINSGSLSGGGPSGGSFGGSFGGGLPGGITGSGVLGGAGGGFGGAGLGSSTGSLNSGSFSGGAFGSGFAAGGIGSRGASIPGASTAAAPIEDAGLNDLENLKHVELNTAVLPDKGNDDTAVCRSGACEQESA